MHELSVEGITIVETIEKRREPLPAMEAIYLITPNEKSIKELMNDFQSQHRTHYRAAHVYFTEVCPEERFKEICNSMAAKRIELITEQLMCISPKFVRKSVSKKFVTLWLQNASNSLQSSSCVFHRSLSGRAFQRNL